METQKTCRIPSWTPLVLALIGSVYSGMVAYSKLATGVCPFGAPCPYLFGVPVCVFGFIGFLVALVLAIGGGVCRDNARAEKIQKGLYWFSLFGAFFALFYLVRELFFISGADAGFFAKLFASSCFYGMMLFTAIHISVRTLLDRSKDNE